MLSVCHKYTVDCVSNDAPLGASLPLYRRSQGLTALVCLDMSRRNDVTFDVKQLEYGTF